VRSVNKELICDAPRDWLFFEHLRRLVNEVAMIVPYLDVELLFFILVLVFYQHWAEWHIS
jgi:hypothetical protein